MTTSEQSNAFFSYIRGAFIFLKKFSDNMQSVNILRIFWFHSALHRFFSLKALFFLRNTKLMWPKGSNFVPSVQTTFSQEHCGLSTSKPLLLFLFLFHGAQKGTYSATAHRCTSIMEVDFYLFWSFLLLVSTIWTTLLLDPGSIFPSILNLIQITAVTEPSDCLKMVMKLLCWISLVIIFFLNPSERKTCFLSLHPFSVWCTQW